ncbi:MAG: lysylphosphatidylglycerol synthase transmembrane domain-containing protein [bacterium]|nr:lysylphosphatidylglycerol synthase transmembrane domain-containing protein [bacterium]
MEKQQSSKKYISSFLFLIVLMIITYCYIFKNCNFKGLGQVVCESKIQYLLLGIAAMFVYIGLEGVNFHIIGHSLGIKFGYIKSFCYACIDIYFCGITPSATGGQPILAYYMSKDDISISKSSIMILLYTVVYKVVLLLLGSLVLIVHFDFIAQSPLTIGLFILGIVINIVIITVCLMCMYSTKIVQGIVVKTINLLAVLHIVKKPQDKIKVFYSLLDDYQASAQFVKNNHRVLWRMLFITLVERVAYFSVGYFVYKALGLNEFGIRDIVAIQVVISITVDSLPLPGAVGVSEAMLFLLYTKVYMDDLIAPAILLTRGINFYMMLLLTGIVTLVFHLCCRRPGKVLKGETIK